MSAWITEASRVAELVFRTADSTQVTVLAGIAVIVLLGALNIFAGPLGIRDMSIARALGFLIPTILLSVAAVVLVRLQVVPRVSHPVLGMALQLACPVIITLVLLPLSAALAKGPYLQCFLATALAVVAAILVTLVVRFAWQAVTETKGWAEGTDTTAERSR